MHKYFFCQTSMKHFLTCELPKKFEEILTFNTYGGIKLGPSYKTIYKDFVGQTTLDLSSLIKKWEKTGALKTLLELDK